MKKTLLLFLCYLFYSFSFAQTYTWTWVSGDDVPVQPSFYGTKGVAAPTNKPGARTGAVSWKDASGNLWLFGGDSYDEATGNFGYLSDLWKYNPSSNQWTWMSGDKTTNQSGFYGAKNSPSSSTKPGARVYAVSWTDASGNLWLFGGDGYSASGWGRLNDLWKYNPASNQWTWVSGDNFANQTGVYGTKGTATSTNKPGARNNAAGWSDANGNLWLFGGVGYTTSTTSGGLNDLWKFNITSGQWTWVSGDNLTNQQAIFGTKGTTTNSNKPGFKSGASTWTDAMGNLWLFGGGSGHTNDLWKYNPTTNQWTWVSGDNVSRQGGNYGTQGVAAASNKPGARSIAVSWTDAMGNLWLFGGNGYPSTAFSWGELNDLWKYNIASNQWTWVSGDNTLYQAAVYGTKGEASPYNKPGGRYAAIGWIDTNDNMWLFGGSSPAGYLNDLWKVGQVSELTYYRDGDSDGYGDPQNTQVASEQPEGYVAVGGDCNDEDYWVHPGAEEYCNGIDDDCDGQIDEDVPSQVTWYRDIDGDGYGNDATAITLSGCVPPGEGYVNQGGDCNDNNAQINPFRTELCNGIDDNCDGLIDNDCTPNGISYQDADGDGYGNPASFAIGKPAGYVIDNTDCNDNDASIHPGATEICNNGKDEDCDGQIDECSNEPAITYYRDGDSDGYGDAQNTTTTTQQPAGYVTNSSDCNDADATVHPGATEICGNGKDEDCDGQVDEGCTQSVFYHDADGDTYGNARDTVMGVVPPVGFVTNATDCDDTNSAVHPGASEVCGNGKDDNCDGQVDEGCHTPKTFYRDADKDGYGDNTMTVVSTTAPAGYVAVGGDCNDKAPSIHPGATEAANGIDDNCDGVRDDGFDQHTFYKDQDRDGYGGTITIQASVAPAGYAPQGSDCNDLNATINPGATEVANGLDDDCDGARDEGFETYTFYKDSDRDGWGGTTTIQAAAAPTGYVSRGGDCIDSRATIYPGAAELCDGLDNDCDGVVDDGLSLTTFYRDADKDGYGGTVKVTTCVAPAGYIAQGGDCNDNNSAIHPGAVEVLNGLDDNCNGVKDEGFTLYTFYKDQDRDGYGGTITTQAAVVPVGYAAVSGDCNDLKATVYPGATELCDGLDNDCNGTIDDGYPVTAFYRDYDKDGWGGATKIMACTAPAGYVAIGGDCNDFNAAIYPGAPEVAGNGKDDNCNGVKDEVLLTGATSSAREATAPLVTSLTVKAMPNPAPAYFTLQISGGSDQPLTIRILDAVGRVKEVRQNVATNSSLQLGNSYQPGIYYAEVLQGSERVVVKLVKSKQ